MKNVRCAAGRELWKRAHTPQFEALSTTVVVVFWVSLWVGTLSLLAFHELECDCLG